MTTYIEIMREAGKKLGIRTLSFDYELISCFLDYDALTPKELINHSSSSQTAFFKRLNDLVEKGILYTEPNGADGRSRLYRLTDASYIAITEQWMRHLPADPSQFQELANPSEALRDFGFGLKKQLKASYLTCEYQILMYLYMSRGLTNIQFSHLVDVSETKFNKSLGQLVKMGLIYSEKNPADGRSKVYYITQETRLTLSQTRKRVVEWSQSRAQHLTDWRLQIEKSTG